MKALTVLEQKRKQGGFAWILIPVVVSSLATIADSVLKSHSALKQNTSPFSQELNPNKSIENDEMGDKTSPFVNSILGV